MKRFGPLFLAIAFLSACSGTRKVQQAPTQDRVSYIQNYKNLAIKEMERTGVPASITMAQALLESDNGNSRLAREANNHFGIKCHKDWKGGKIYHHDDARNECFRKYRTVYESYEDHSDFLRAGSRYQFLFGLDPKDYKGWAKGLKAAGYATNRHYDDLLIRIIEENRLYELDGGVAVAWQQPEVKEEAETETETQPGTGNPGGGFTVSLGGRQISQNNRIDYIVARDGDSFAALAREYNLMPWEIYRYNDLPRDAIPREGQIIYLQPKRNQAESGFDFHVVREGETMYGISQQYGIKLSRLYQMNGMKEGTEPAVGTRLVLRGKSGLF